MKKTGKKQRTVLSAFIRVHPCKILLALGPGRSFYGLPVTGYPGAPGGGERQRTPGAMLSYSGAPKGRWRVWNLHRPFGAHCLWGQLSGGSRVRSPPGYSPPAPFGAGLEPKGSNDQRNYRTAPATGYRLLPPALRAAITWRYMLARAVTFPAALWLRWR